MADLDILNSLKAAENSKAGKKAKKDEEFDSDDDSREDGDDAGKGKKKYSVIPQSVREKFIKRVLSKEVTIKEAAKEFGLKFSTSKAILQTYKKEGRIGKKKNRERKTKVINAIFIANINPSFTYTSTVANMTQNPENKINKNDNSKPRTVESSFLQQQDQKIINQNQFQFPNDQAKNLKKEPNPQDLFKEFLEKMNANANKFQTNTLTQGLNISALTNIPNNTLGSLGQNTNTSTMGNIIQLTNPQHNLAQNFIQNNNNLAGGFININPNQINQGIMGSNQNINPGVMMNNHQTHISSNNTISIPSLPVNIPTLNNTFLLPQTTIGGMFGSDFSQQNNLAQLGFQVGDAFGNVNQKRPLPVLENNTIPDLELKNEQVSDVSVKRFRSSEEILWDFDYDKSKRDLEDFIFRTHSAMKNNNNFPENNKQNFK